MKNILLADYSRNVTTGKEIIFRLSSFFSFVINCDLNLAEVCQFKDLDRPRYYKVAFVDLHIHLKRYPLVRLRVSLCLLCSFSDAF